MDKSKVTKTKDIIQSSSLNFLFGSGLSTPFLPVLNDIELRLNNAHNELQRTQIRKEYLEKVMLPNKKILENQLDDLTPDANGQSEKQRYDKAAEQYKIFFNHLANILFDRKGTILSKQANIFTTNIDVFIEKALEESNFEYNDGFSGKLDPIFDISNFKKTIQKRSLHFENVSEIPTFNVIKAHGSLTWKKSSDGGKIVFSKLDHFDNSLLGKNGKPFRSRYDEILVVNPENTKFQKTVLDVIYYELLRAYSSELEKENAVLFVMGFSMEDEHIRQITLRSANSNPTLTIYIFCHSKDGVDALKAKIGNLRYNNIEIIEPADDRDESKLNFENINKELFSKILHVRDLEVESDEQTS